ncbi:acetyl-CoA hydrolase/transferase family protein [Clostridium ganghwense]|uniref:4-hydroxybutyrate--acetyl-CoA CoA transferase n=1 Tax=Clostridium ganghwense TaxID=312089 RepID=A0ABT4CSU1_9CLOT|nr:acetyl-CoA hydrolase/transferase C-terminal domain-containing protein [Clostridium ganghwense]MCY6372143.1 4-hydroxybutyrate--acetyl-CoA CoA transferase [Clostridium ganghwense]
MNYYEEYKKKHITLDDALSMVKSNTDICVGLAVIEPIDFMSRLHEVADRVENVNILTCLNMSNYKFFSQPDMKGHFTNCGWFYTPMMRKAHSHGTCSYIPNHLHISARDRLSYKKPNIFIATSAPMDKHGYFNLSLSVTYEREFLEAADIVILEVSDNYPRTCGDTNIHISEVDYVYETNRKVPVFPYAPSSEKDVTIGNYIAELIKDGSTIQLGIGGIPNAVASALGNKKDLGVHTELFNDGMLNLIEAGVITNRKKTLHKGKSITTMIMGSQKLYDFVDQNPGVEVLRGSYVNDPNIVGRNYKMVSINTTLEVDLTGQCCSESLGTKQFSGTGGQADTAIGSQNSVGGKSIIALYSTTKNKKTGEVISKIVPTLMLGAGVSLSRNDVDYIVTEYGTARLTGCTIRERVNNLIGIAHPDFRGELRKEANELMLW